MNASSSNHPLDHARGFILSACCVLAACLLSSAPAGEGVIVRSNPAVYNASLGFVVSGGKGAPSVMTVNIPLAASNAYQDVSLKGTPPGEVLTIDESGDKYVRMRLTRDRLAGGEQRLEYEFEVTLYDIRVDFSRVRATDSYRKDGTYQLYTSSTRDYIVPDNPSIVNITRNIGNESRDNVDFTRRAYEYVAKQYRHSAQSDILLLEKILAAGGGNSCNLCSIYVSILRRRGIPARHLSGYTPEGGVRFIVEFYIENYGWIPVDVAARALNPDADFFGVLPRQVMPVLLSRGLNLPVEGQQGIDRVPTMVTGVVWWQPRKAAPKVEFSFICERAD